MKKKIFSILAVLALVLSLVSVAGCGDKTPAGGQGTASGSSSQDEEEFFLDMPSELKGTTVKFATWIDHQNTDTLTCITGFEQTTGMKYEMVSVPQGDYISKLISLIAADQAPDVVVENGDFPRTLELLMPLTKEETGMDVTDPFWDQNLVKLFTIGKYCYLVNGANSSWNMAGACTYFNKTILEENGLKTPKDLVDENNWNLDSFYKLMGQIKTSCGFTRSGTVIDVTNFLATYGAQEVVFNAETDQFSNGTGSPQMLTGLQWLAKAASEGLAEMMLEGSHPNIENGTGAIQTAGAYGLRNKPGWFYAMDLDDLGYTYLPKINADDEDYPFTYSTRAYGICRGSRNPKGAAYFLRYFLNEDHYDVDKIFKTEEARTLYNELRAKGNPNVANFQRGVRMTANPDSGGLTSGLLGSVVWGSASQLSVNLAAASNNVDAGVKKANELIQGVIANQ